MGGCWCVWSARDPPRPIPNRVVKPRSAEGTGEMTPWESRSMHHNHHLSSPAAYAAGDDRLCLHVVISPSRVKEVMRMNDMHSAITATTRQFVVRMAS